MKSTKNFDYHLFLLKVEELRDTFAALSRAMMKDIKPVIEVINNLNKVMEKLEKKGGNQ